VAEEDRAKLVNVVSAKIAIKVLAKIATKVTTKTATKDEAKIAIVDLAADKVKGMINNMGQERAINVDRHEAPRARDRCLSTSSEAFHQTTPRIKPVKL
jgi:hypothetical protein